MDFNSSEIIMLNLIKQAVESEGCRIADVDLENLKVKVDGPDNVIGACSQAVAEILD